MSDINVGDTWVNKLDETNTVTVGNVGAFAVTGSSAKDGQYMGSKNDFLHYFKPMQQGRKDDSSKPKHSHYHKNVSQYDTIDIYVICDLYVKDNSGCIQHAVKKLLCCGERGVKDNVKDLQEAIDTIQRKIEMLEGKK